MGISKPKRPEFPVVGTVATVEPRTKKGTAEIFKTDVIVLTPSGGQALIEFWESNENAPELPKPGELRAFIVEVSENAQYGASLGVVRYANPGDVDLYRNAAKIAA